MFRIKNTILSDEIASAKFSCDLEKCRGACCVIGDAGAPVSKDEIPELKKSWDLLKDELPSESVAAVQQNGLIEKGVKDNHRIQCRTDGACVFVSHSDQGIAYCSIQKAFLDGRLDWKKPISCHLYPIRLNKVAGFVYASFAYSRRLCSAACDKGRDNEIFLSEFLKEPLVRRFGESWYQKFKDMCEEIRNNNGKAASLC